MNRNVRLKINQSLEEHVLSKMLLLACLACLHEKIAYSEKKLPVLEKERDIIARTSVSNGITKAEIKEGILKISPQDYPTLKTIEQIAYLCDSGNYSYNVNYIPEKMIHMKSEEELSADRMRIPPKKKRDVALDELSELVQYIEKEIMYIRLTDSMISRLKELRCGEYSYSVILKAFQWYHRDIKLGTRRDFDTLYDKFKYILGIIKNVLPDTKRRIEQMKKAEEKMDYTLPIAYISDHQAEYRARDNKPVQKKFEELW